MLKIKGWEEHQPSLRPDRNVIWIKVYRRLLDDFGWSNLTDSNKATLLELWLLASETNGELPDVEEIAYRLRKDKSFINKQLEQLTTFVLQVGNKSATKRQTVGKLSATKRTTLGSLDVKIDIDKSRDRDRYAQEFDTFWKIYPKKAGRHKAEECWNKTKPDLKTVLKALKWQMSSKDWFEESGKYIPHPTTYLNQKRYLDEPSAEVTF
jgi:hypothetical protein